MPGSWVLDFVSRLERVKAVFQNSDGSQSEIYVPDVYEFIMSESPATVRWKAFELMNEFTYRAMSEHRDPTASRKAAITIACGKCN